MCPCIIDFIGGMDYKGEWGEGALDTPGPLNGSATPSLVLQVSGLSDTPSLPLGQAAQLLASLSDSTASLPMLSPISSISSSSLQSAKSRDPRLNRSVSANSRKMESDMESDEYASVAAARTGHKRDLTGGRNGPKSNDLTAFFNRLRPHLDSPISPVLVGDFNCIQEPLDCTPGLI